MNSLLSSQLHDNKNFYKSFIKDLKGSRKCVLTESPFITSRRMDNLLPILRNLRKRKVSIVINTRKPEEHEKEFEYQATLAVYEMQQICTIVLYTGRHHWKLAIIDNEIL